MGNSAQGISRRLADAASVFKPNVASLGYALFLAVNATGVWGGVFPFLPLHFQTPQILFWFFLAQSVTFFASFVASGLGAYFPARADQTAFSRFGRRSLSCGMVLPYRGNLP